MKNEEFLQIVVMVIIGLVIFFVSYPLLMRDLKFLADFWK